MNQKIHLHISSITEKASRLIQQLSALKNENEKLLASNKELQVKLAESDENLNEFKRQNAKLEESQSTLLSANDASSESSKERNQEIDQLVREIENCIDQLKR
jgi:predicted nuclease with TOPRIM domain